METPVKNKLLLKTKTLSIPASPLMKTLGYGTGVTVYKLERSPSRSPWVLKRISKKAKNESEMNIRLKCEAEVLRRLNHQNIVGFRAFVAEKDGRKCIAMEDCTISLGDMIEAKVDDEQDVRPFSSVLIMKMMTDIGNALEYLHNHALILHGDIKSYNVLLKNDFEVCKLCDFGVSMPLRKDGTIDAEKAGPEFEYVGTPCWMAPELFGETPLITIKADIYSYGLVIWEMIALDHPNTNNLEPEFDSEASLEDELLDDSQGSELDNSQCEEERVRPKVPCEFLDDSYLPILQIYYLCTEQDHTKRPNAKDLCLLIQELENNK